MKLLAYTTVAKRQKSVDVEPQAAKSSILQLFSEGFNRVLAKWKDELFVLELVDDRTQTLNTRISNPDDIQFTKTRIAYHPYMNQLS